MNLYKIALPLCAAMFAAGVASSCNDDDTDYDNPSGETYIYEIAVSNGGFTGAEKITGELNQEARTIEFTIPAETDIEAVTFTTKLSLGASLDKPSYDVTSGSAAITVVNNENSSVYNATFHILPATQKPIVRSIECRDAEGNARTGFVSDVTGTVYLNCEGSGQAEIVSVSTLPRRATWSLTNATDNVVKAEDAGKLVLEFEGFTTEYDLSFLGTPTFGADFSKAVVYDYSATGTIWPDFSGENTRWGQFDGENFLFMSRQGGVLPTVIKWDEVVAGSPVAHVLDVTGIGVGTHPVSACGIAGGHFYGCNLSTGLAADQPLQVYHWADVNATCETVLTFAGNDDVKGRWGDNMSVTLDAGGNGWLWFFAHADGSIAVRFAVTGFNQVSDTPEVITCPYSLAYYASINEVIGEPGYYSMTSGYQASVLLTDVNLNLLNHIDPLEGYDYPYKGDQDARIINYNGERYLLCCNYNGWGNEKPETLHVYNISDGKDAVMAFSSFNEGPRELLYEYSLGGRRGNVYSSNTGAAIGPDGELRLMACSPTAGFIFVEVPKKL